jgi:uncharacterized membrane protein YwaF
MGDSLDAQSILQPMSPYPNVRFSQMPRYTLETIIILLLLLWLLGAFIVPVGGALIHLLLLVVLVVVVVRLLQGRRVLE